VWYTGTCSDLSFANIVAQIVDCGGRCPLYFVSFCIAYASVHEFPYTSVFSVFSLVVQFKLHISPNTQAYSF
jgi:hypothetical protein